VEAWIGVDFDSTLVVGDSWGGFDKPRTPVPAMVARVKSWLQEGKRVKIFTARVSHDGSEASRAIAHQARVAIEVWCLQHIGQWLEVTNVKDFGMVQLWDDRAVRVIPNTGQLCCLAKRDEEETIG
jgi:hypothetical protein